MKGAVGDLAGVLAASEVERELIWRAALRARKALANLDVDRTPRTLEATLSGVKHELDTILASLLPSDADRLELFEPPRLPSESLSAPDEHGDPTLWADPL